MKLVATALSVSDFLKTQNTSLCVVFLTAKYETNHLCPF